MKDKIRYDFKIVKRIKNVNYHEINLSKFIESSSNVGCKECIDV